VIRMEVETVWGTVKTRKVATRLTKQEYVLLKDNPELEPLFRWLEVCKIKTVKDVGEGFREKMIKTLRNCEVNFEVVHDEVMPMLVFRNAVPLEGSFSSAIREILKIFYGMMYNPDEECLHE